MGIFRVLGIPSESNVIQDNGRFSRAWNDFFTSVISNLKQIYPSQDAATTGVWDAMDQAANSGCVDVNNPVPFRAAFRDGTTNSPAPGLTFNTTETNSAVFTFVMPNGWDNVNGNIVPHLHWSSSANTAENNSANTAIFKVDWGLHPEGSGAGDFDAGTEYITLSPANSRLSEEDSLANIQGSSDYDYTSVFSAVVTRDTSNGSDTYANTITLNAFGLRYQRNKIGSSKETAAASTVRRLYK